MLRLFGLCSILVLFSWILVKPIFCDFQGVTIIEERKWFNDSKVHVNSLRDFWRFDDQDFSPFKKIMRDPNYYISPTYNFVAGFMTWFFLPTIAHNLFFISMIFLAGLAMFFLAKQHKFDDISAVFSAFGFMSLQYLTHHYIDGHGHQIQIFWYPLSFLILENCIQRLKWSDFALFGLCVGLIVLSCTHFILYVTIFWMLYVLTRDLITLKQVRLYVGFLLSSVVCLLTCGYYLYLYSRNPSQIFDIGSNNGLSLHVMELWKSNNEVSINWVYWIFAGIGTIYALIQRNRFFGIWIIFFILSTLFSMGPYSDYAPYMWLYKYLPMYDHTRTPVRMILVAQLAVIFLATYGFYQIKSRIKKPIYQIGFSCLAITIALGWRVLELNQIRSKPEICLKVEPLKY